MDKDSTISWSEALKHLNEIIHEMASDQRDHWVQFVTVYNI